jgi:hypothetical protein
VLAERPDRAGDEDLVARDLTRVTGELDPGLVDRDELLLEVARGELRPVRTERVRLDQLGAGVDEADVDGDDGVRRADIRLLGAPEPLRRGGDERPHAAVGDDRRSLAKPVEEARCHSGDCSDSSPGPGMPMRRVNSSLPRD